MMALLESQVVKEILLLLFVGAVSSIGYLVIRRHVLGLLQSLFVRSKLQWDEIIIEKGVLHSAALLIPAFIVSQALPFLEVTNEFVLLVLSMWSLVVVTITLDRLLDVVVAVYNTFPVSQRVPITGYVQIVKIALFVFAVVIGFSILVGQSPWRFWEALVPSCCAVRSSRIPFCILLPAFSSPCTTKSAGTD